MRVGIGARNAKMFSKCSVYFRGVFCTIQGSIALTRTLAGALLGRIRCCQAGMKALMKILVNKELQILREIELIGKRRDLVHHLGFLCYERLFFVPKDFFPRGVFNVVIHFVNHASLERHLSLSRICEAGLADQILFQGFNLFGNRKSPGTHSVDPRPM